MNSSFADRTFGLLRRRWRVVIVTAALAVAGVLAGWLIARSGEKPAAKKRATTAPAVALGSTCESSLYRFRISYPTGWFVADGDPESACTIFHPIPIKIEKQAGLPPVAVSIHTDQGRYAEILAAQSFGPELKLISRRDATVDGRAAVVTETEQTGLGYYAVGTHTYGYLIDVRGVALGIGTSGFKGDEFARYRQVVDAMVATLKFLPGVRPGAAARGWIEVGQGIAGVTLDQTRQDVRDVLGAPVTTAVTVSTELGSVVEYRYPGLAVTFAGQVPKVVRITTRRRIDRTRAGAGAAVGSPVPVIKNTIPDPVCRPSASANSGVCSTVGRREPGQRVTDYTFANGLVTEVSVYLWRGGRVAVKIYLPRGNGGPNCDQVRPVARSVAAPALAGAMSALLEGPMPGELTGGFESFFTQKTAGMLRSARVAGGVAYIDFRNFSRIIPGANASCGSAMLFSQLDRTATQFTGVRRAVYSFDGSPQAFYEWQQRSPPR